MAWSGGESKALSIMCLQVGQGGAGRVEGRAGQNGTGPGFERLGTAGASLHGDTPFPCLSPPPPPVTRHRQLLLQNPRWLAPEVLGGLAGGLPADVWAFGTVLWVRTRWRCADVLSPGWHCTPALLQFAELQPPATSASPFAWVLQEMATWEAPFEGANPYTVRAS